ncbi:MAG: hypothetical protein D6713_06475 [Deltaproteobacteria bacterium]|nr:MAG: hypothetical protein D6713_06475 [Deltaproteobacteria bacterium]
MKSRFPLVVLCSLLVLSLCAFTSSASTLEDLKEEVARQVSPEERAKALKMLGDHYAAIEDYRNAAAVYIEALSLSRASFSLDERFEMAVRISWGDYLEEAETELRKILDDDPSRIDARVHLARVLSWMDRLDEAIAEADRVLKENPGNVEALLVKANALRWRGDADESIPLYEEILQKGEDFEARLGLTYAYLDTGYYGRARESFSRLKPAYPYQEKSQERVEKVIVQETSPSLSGAVSFYSDSDDNRWSREEAEGKFLAGDWTVRILGATGEAKAPSRGGRYRSVSAEGRLLRGRFDLRGSLGLSSLHSRGSGSVVTGALQVKFLGKTLRGGARFSREVFTDTAELIENRITSEGGSFFVEGNPVKRLRVTATFDWREYSDGNGSRAVRLEKDYLLSRKSPKLSLGGRLRYTDFRRQSGSGYFDPDDYISLQAYTSLYHEVGEWYFYLEPYGGYQRFRRYGEKSEDLVGGGFASIGFNPSRRVTLELNGEGGNFSLGTAAGFRYLIAGFYVSIVF